MERQSCSSCHGAGVKIKKMPKGSESDRQYCKYCWKTVMKNRKARGAKTYRWS